jgi:hypothetical protein
LKQLLTSDPILRIIDPNEDFIVCTDACNEGLGGVVSQNGFVICYESRKLKEHERNYATHDLELAVIVHALRKWRHYLMGKRFELRIDHSGLKYLFDHPNINSSQRRWLEFLSEYDFDIRHIKGKENKVDNALIRREHELHATTINMYPTDVKRKILEARNTDLQYKELVAILQQGKTTQRMNNYKLGVDGILLHKNNFFIPNVQDLKHIILHEMHNTPYVGHPGYQNTITTVKSQYFWLGMKREIVEYITSCMKWKKVKTEHRHPT